MGRKNDVWVVKCGVGMKIVVWVEERCLGQKKPSRSKKWCVGRKNGGWLKKMIFGSRIRDYVKKKMLFSSKNAVCVLFEAENAVWLVGWYLGRRNDVRAKKCCSGLKMVFEPKNCFLGQKNIV